MKIGVDVGGTKVRMGVFRDKPVKLVGKAKLRVTGDFENDLVLLVGEVKRLVGGGKVEMAGVGLPGVVNERQGVMVKSPNLKGWEGKSVRRRLIDELGCKVQVMNDTTMAGLGEVMYGPPSQGSCGGVSPPPSIKGRTTARQDGEKEGFLYVNWGTGWGVVYLERVRGSWRVKTMEAGHQIVEWQGPECGCGQRGCLETYVGGGNAIGTYGKKMEEIEDNGVWDEIARKAAQGLVNTLVHYPVDLVLFGGGVILNQEHLLERMRRMLKEKLKIYPVPELKMSKLGEWAGVWGGAIGNK